MSTKSRWLVLLSLALSLTACGPDDPIDEGLVDGEQESAFGSGKADDLMSFCEQEHVLLLLNDRSTDSDRLFDAGVHRRAANNLAEFRAGDDERLGTDDDRYFRSLEEVDAVFFVGPAAIQQLTAAIADFCRDQPFRQAHTIFSPNDYYSSHIDEVVRLFDEAERSIDIAMYSMSDNRAVTALGDAAARGVRIRLLLDGANGDHLNPQGSRSARLEDLGVDVRYINRIMHHKFAIIDGAQTELLEASTARVFSGSGNLSFGAAVRYDENTTFHEGFAPLALTLQREFNHLWENSRDFQWNEDLEYFETLPIPEEAIPPTEGLEVLFTSENFETTYHSTWGPGFRPLVFSQVVADSLVELIEGARSSIFMAASFLRSRPVSEALLRRWSEDPDLDVRIYLDQSEYISQWFHGSQLSDLASCLEDAGDDDRATFDCEQRGFIFSYSLVDAGIPVRFKNYSYRWHFSYALQMHHKYIVIDGHTVATGSYNYSNNAEQNTMENVVIYRGSHHPDLVAGFVENFETIWETGRSEGLYEELLDTIESAPAGAEVDILFEPTALTWQEVTTLRQFLRQRCPEIDSEEYRRYPQDNRTCVVQ